LRLLSASLPIVIIILASAWALLHICFPAEQVDMEKANIQLEKEMEQFGPLSRREIRVGIISVATILAWIFGFKLIGLATIALLAVALLFMFRLVNWSEIESNVNWGIILMYGGAIALGSALHSSGASHWIIENSLGKYHLSPLMLIVIMGFLSLILTEFISNAAVVSVMMPVGLALANANNLSPEAVTLAIALPSGLAFMLPMGTPATAIAYSSGFIPMKNFVKYGMMMIIISLIAFILTAWLYWPLIGLK
jgi:sodium-dependent dicarboxylate transporter 2/3/5